MGSEAPTTTSFHITGFKKFHGVPMNPSEALATALPAYLAKAAPLPAGATLGSCTVLETAAWGARDALIDLLDQPYQETQGKGKGEGEEEEAGGEGKEGEGKGAGKERLGREEAMGPTKRPRVLWVHLGVNSGASKFAIERRAVNEATFRCPDEMGWQPQKEMIAKEDHSLTFARKTPLPAGWIVDTLRSRGFDVVLSDDAGRFVCNYVYYQSLRHADLVTGATCLFVHVPPFAVIDEATQLRFIATLLEVLTSC